MRQLIRLIVNGDPYEVVVKPSETILDVLREKLGLTGTKRGCDTGKCGACTVLVDSKLVRSCLMLAISVRDREITTIEGLAKNGDLHPIQKAFIEHGAVQCGFCTPGMIMFTKSFLEENPKPQDEEIREALSGNICRCTGYVKVIEAIKAASEEMRQWQMGRILEKSTVGNGAEGIGCSLDKAMGKTSLLDEEGGGSQSLSPC